LKHLLDSPTLFCLNNIGGPDDKNIKIEIEIRMGDKHNNNKKAKILDNIIYKYLI